MKPGDLVIFQDCLDIVIDKDTCGMIVSQYMKGVGVYLVFYAGTTRYFTGNQLVLRSSSLSRDGRECK